MECGRNFLWALVFITSMQLMNPPGRSNVADAQSAPPAVPAEPIMDSCIFGDSEWTCFIVINGVPLSRHSHSQYSTTIKFGYEKPGANSLNIFAIRDNAFLKDSDDLKISIQRAAGRGQPSTVAQLTLKAADAKAEIGKSIQFTGVPGATGTFEKAQQVGSLKQADRDQIYAILRQYADAMKKQDIDAMIKIMDFSLSAIPPNLQAMARSGISGDLRQEAAATKSVELQEIANLSFRAFDRGVIVWNQPKDPETLPWVLRTFPNNDLNHPRFRTEFVFCKIGETWVMF